MSIRIDADHLVELSKVPSFLEKRIGKRLNLATVYRWRQRGIAGIYLDVILVGAKPFTSTEALDRFFQQSALAKSGRLSNATAEGIKRARLIRQKQLEAEADSLGL